MSMTEQAPTIELDFHPGPLRSYSRGALPFHELRAELMSDHPAYERWSIGQRPDDFEPWMAHVMDWSASAQEVSRFAIGAIDG